MIIFGITGAIGHGKSTLAEAFGKVEPNSRHFETFTVIADVIDAWHTKTAKIPNPHDLAEVNNWLTLLPPILSQYVHEDIDASRLAFTMEDIMANPDRYQKLFVHIQNIQKNPGLMTSRVTDLNKEFYRPMLQWLGGYLVAKVDPGIWYNEIMRTVQQAKAEGVELCTIGGVRYLKDAEIVRNGGGQVILIHRPMIGEQDMSDPTERERSRIKPDITIQNDGGLAELVAVAQRIYADEKIGRVQGQYEAMNIRQT
jgi:hypothetical protein